MENSKKLNLNAKLNHLKKGVILGVALAAGTVTGVTSCAQDADDQEQEYTAAGYDRFIGNGNYNLRNFFGADTTFNSATAVSDVNRYLNGAGKYVHNQTAEFEKTLNDRPAAKAYFNDYLTAIANDDRFHIDDTKTGKGNFDVAANRLVLATEPVLSDIIKNLDTFADRYSFFYAYRILTNEAYREGMGQYAKPGYTFYDDRYTHEKYVATSGAQDYDRFANVDFDREYGSNNFKGVTNLTDELLEIAANNMNRKKGLDVRAADLRQMVNMNMNFWSLAGMHEASKSALNHNLNNGCGIRMEYDKEMIRDAINQARLEEMNQARSL